MRIIAELMRGCLKQVVGGSSTGSVMESTRGEEKKTVQSWNIYHRVLGFNSKFDNLN